MTDDLANLAHHVKARREARNWSQVHVWKKKGGPSNTKLTQIEAALPPTPSPATLRKLDKGLEWESGSAEIVLLGGEPTELPDADGPPDGLGLHAKRRELPQRDRALRPERPTRPVRPMRCT